MTIHSLYLKILVHDYLLEQGLCLLCFLILHRAKKKKIITRKKRIHDHDIRAK